MAADPSRVPPAGSAGPPPSPIALAAIRIALLLGVLLFGAVTLYIRRRGTLVPVSPESLETLRAVGIGIWAVAVIAVLLLRLKGFSRGRPAAADPSIIGWAIGEAVALFGGVQFFLSGAPAWYINGVLFLVATFVIFPIRARTG